MQTRTQTWVRMCQFGSAAVQAWFHSLCFWWLCFGKKGNLMGKFIHIKMHYSWSPCNKQTTYEVCILKFAHPRANPEPLDRIEPKFDTVIMY